MGMGYPGQQQAMMGYPQMMPGQMMPNMYRPPVATHYSIDVECVATGMGHNDREVAQIGMVDEYGNQLGNWYVKPTKEVTSYLTSLTGITKETFENAETMTLEEAMVKVRSVLPKHAVLVGQNIAKDIAWLGLKEGEDFHEIVDLVGVFQVWNTQYSSYTKFSLAHVVKVLLGVQDEGRIHNAVADAQLSMMAYNAFRQIEAYNPAQLLQLQQALLREPMAPSFARRNPTYENVCMGYKKNCNCGQPFEY